MNYEQNNTNGIAVVGMSGRFPRSNDIYKFWDNLINARECISFFDEEEVVAFGVDPELVRNPNYIKAKGILDHIDIFDASFFGINPREAELMDPQHRLLLECAWEALENAGYACENYRGYIGVYAGAGMNSYMLLNVYPYIKKVISAGTLIAAIGNDKDSLTTTISYRMNLRGPSITIQSSSSTSLVAVCTACQSLLTYQCDMALAGGAAIGPPLKGGYLYEEGGILSPDGHCRPFDASSKGFVPGMGMGLVVLKRLSDAIKDRDYIWAVIKGFAVNNDGSNKVSYSAPSVDMQAEVVAEAQAVAGVSPDCITYIETHGTGTMLGDPIELAALTQVFGSATEKKQYCAIGSVKSNIGHLDTAAGIAGLIKTCMAIKRKKIPPSINYSVPNPKIDFEKSPFFVNTSLRDWESNGIPRCAGVTSLGMGGTNAHVVLEEIENQRDISEERKKKDCHIVPLSAKTPTALEKYTMNLISFLRREGYAEIDGIAYTLAVGRNAFPYRRAIICSDIEELTNPNGLKTENVYTSFSDTEKKIAFMFSGQGSQYINMGHDIYSKEIAFREAFDYCAEVYKKYSGYDIRDILYNTGPDKSDGAMLDQTQYAQPALFIFEYAMAKMLMSWDITPSFMIGHSLGEYAAACLSGVVNLEDALKIIYIRANLMQRQQPGSMLAVGCDECQTIGIIEKPDYQSLSIAALNSPELCVVSGDSPTISRLKNELEDKNIFCRLLKTSHAFHSRMMEPILDDFANGIADVRLKKPQIPYISCVSGTWITDADIEDNSYWIKQIRNTVRFSDGIKQILKMQSIVLLEIGPEDTLASLAKKHLGKEAEKEKDIMATMAPKIRKTDSYGFLLQTVARIWANGGTINWDKFYINSPCCRVPLPTYPFEGKSYWIGNDISKQPELEKHEKDKTENFVQAVDASYESRPDLTSAYKEPRSPMEMEIAQIWESLLGIRSIGLEDDFFELGGHSLLATQVLSRIEYKYQIKISLKEIFYEFTISKIVEILNSKMNQLEFHTLLRKWGLL